MSQGLRSFQGETVTPSPLSLAVFELAMYRRKGAA